MALPNWQRTITTTTGDVVPGAEVEVVNETTGLTADLYTSRAGTSAKSNPFFADSTGFAEFYADPGEYRITATGAAGSQTWRYEVLTGTAALMTNDTGGESLRSAALMANDTGKGSVYNAVASSLGTLSVEPDVFIPFNDSVELERGYGNRDSNGNRAVDFSRASGSQYVNKSGEMKQLVADEPAITSDGIGIFSSFTNELLNSEDVSQWNTSEVANVVQDGTLSSDGVNQAWFVSSGGNYLKASVVNANPTNEFWLMSVDVKKADVSRVLLRWVEFVDGTTKLDAAQFDFSQKGFVTNSAEYVAAEELNDEWFRLYIGSTSNNSGNKNIRLDIAGYNGTSVQGSVYVSKGSIVRNAPKSKIPYVKTESTSVTRAEDVAQIPTRGNIPSYGKPFTIMLDTSVPFSDGSYFPFIFDIKTIPSGPFLARRNTINTNLQFYFCRKDGSGRAVGAVGVDDKKHRLAFRFDGVSISIHVDGPKKAATTINPADGYPLVDFSGQINVGFGGNNRMNSHIKNFKIYHTALTDEQIAALGGPDV